MTDEERRERNRAKCRAYYYGNYEREKERSRRYQREHALEIKKRRYERAKLGKGAANAG